MLVLEARGKKVLLGICDELGQIRKKVISSTPPVSVFEYLKSEIKAFDPSFSPFKIGVTVTPGLLSPMLQSLNFSKVLFT